MGSFAVHLPARSQLEGLASRIRQLEGAALQAPIPVEAQRELEVRLLAREVRLSRLEAGLPTLLDIPHVLRRVEAEAREAGLRLDALHPERVAPTDATELRRFRLQVEGPFPAFWVFLEALAETPWFLVPEVLIIEGAGSVRAELVISTRIHAGFRPFVSPPDVPIHEAGNAHATNVEPRRIIPSWLDDPSRDPFARLDPEDAARSVRGIELRAVLSDGNPLRALALLGWPGEAKVHPVRTGDRLGDGVVLEIRPHEVQIAVASVLGPEILRVISSATPPPPSDLSP